MKCIKCTEENSNTAKFCRKCGSPQTVDKPQADAIPPAQVNASGKTSAGLSAKVAGTFCYVFGWISGIVLLIVEKEDINVRFHAWQSILTFGILTVIIWLLFLVPPVPAGIAVFLIYTAWAIVITFSIFLWILLILKAYQGQVFLLPGLGRIALSITYRGQRQAMAGRETTGTNSRQSAFKSAVSKFCIICGQILPAKAVYCSKCGEKQE